MSGDFHAVAFVGSLNSGFGGVKSAMGLCPGTFMWALGRFPEFLCWKGGICDRGVSAEFHVDTWADFGFMALHGRDFRVVA